MKERSNNGPAFSLTVLILLSVALFITAGCIVRTMHYFEVEGEEQATHGRIDFAIGEIDTEIRSLHNEKILQDPRYGPWLSEIGPRYGGVEYNPDLLYWALEVLYKRPDAGECSDYILHPDSICIAFDSGYAGSDQTLLNPISKKVVESNMWYVNIEPITTPKHFRGDFSVSFNLTITDTCFVDSVERIPITVKCVHKQKKWTPLYPGQP